ncbi:MAG: cation-efflux pump [Candidatus Bathyarchaeota archaeon]|jgi:cation diffusion facilitator family transporter|nr:cation-efflux pump [Candidatus Bathyarchaeota archaeon]
MHISEKRLRALKISTCAIASVVIVEVVLGFAAGSLAILSDGAHALLDTISMFILLIATKASLKPADEEHMYGHEKIEPLGGLIGGVILFGTAIFLIIRALQKVLQGEIAIVQEWELAGFAAIAYTLCVDILRVGVLHKTRWESVTVKAGFYHSVADLGSTLIALFGFGMAALGFPIFDVVASLVLSAAIGYLSVKLVKASGMELSDAVSKEFAEKVRKEILSTEGVSKIGSLRVRRAGAKTFVEATIQVPDYISLEESHMLASKVEDNLKRFLGDAEVVVHVEPQEDILTKKLVEKLAAGVKGVKEVHEVNAVFAHNKLYITLHAHVDPKLSVREAHELAEKIEGKLNEKIENIGNVTVHIEPFNTKKQRGPKVNEEKIQQAIYQAAESFQQVFTVKRIVTYVVGEKRYINIDCCFTSQISIEEAHRVASKIENGVKRRFTETIVTVHMEPKKEEAAA